MHADWLLLRLVRVRLRLAHLHLLLLHLHVVLLLLLLLLLLVVLVLLLVVVLLELLLPPRPGRCLLRSGHGLLPSLRLLHGLRLLAEVDLLPRLGLRV